VFPELSLDKLETEEVSACSIVTGFVPLYDVPVRPEPIVSVSIETPVVLKDFITLLEFLKYNFSSA
jgi:hypothetical protein